MNKAAKAASRAAAVAALVAAVVGAAGSSSQAATPGVSTTRTYVVGADTVTVNWYENGVFTLARRITINGPQTVTVDRYQAVYCTSVQRGPVGQPPIAWTPPSGIRTQCAPYVDVNGAHLTPPSQDPVTTTPPPVPVPTVPFP